MSDDWLMVLGETMAERHAAVLSVPCPFCGATVGELCRRGNPFGYASANGSKHGPRWTEAVLAAGGEVPDLEAERAQLRSYIASYENRHENVWQAVPGVRLTP